jgi:Amt family ammonium transporter
MGTLLCAVLASGALGVFSGQGYPEGMSMGSQMGVQVLGVAAVAAWTAVATAILLKLVDVLVGLRVSAEEETAGLDLTQHEERGYNY